MVGIRRLELPRVAPLVPETSASTNSAICPVPRMLNQTYAVCKIFLFLYVINNRLPGKSFLCSIGNISTFRCVSTSGGKA